MKYQKLTATIFLSAIGILQAACLPLNFPQSPKNSAADQSIENKQPENIAEISTKPKETKKVSAEKTNSSATPKLKSPPDNFVCPEPNLPCNLSINRRATIKFAVFETASSFNPVFNG